DKYMKIKIKEFDLEVVHDALPKDSIIADIGAGKNKLGKQILEYSDQNKLNVKYVIGTDIEDWSDKQGRPDSRLSFILQESSIQFPLSSNTYDAIIVKWVLHHMNEEDQKAFLKSIHHILKPGGCLIILDSLGATIEDKEILEGFLKETGNSRTWPAGSFYEANYKLTMDFMKLTPQQQLQVHALEDFFGHNLIMGRNWMPQPFSYRTVAEFKEFLGRLGFNENKELRRVYGSAPIMRMGPPSIRLVFEKERRKPLFIAGGGGNNKAMVLIDGMGPGEKEHVRNILDVLEARDLSKQEIMRKKFDDIVLLGNERLDTFSETLELLNGGIGERIVILGNYGKATIPLIDVAVSNGYKIELAGKFVVDENNWWDIKRILKIDELRDIITVSEANIIRQIMLQIINANTTDFEPLRQRIEKEGIEDIIIVADSSEITQKLLVQYRQMLDQKKVFERTTPYDILLAQNPYRQLRGKAAFIELLSSEIAQGKVSIVSHTTSFDNIASTKSIVYPDLLEEAWRLVLYSDYGNIFINLRSEKYPRGIDDIPNIFWQSAAVLFDSLNNIEKKRLADRLVSLLEKERLSIDDICKTTNFSLREFIVKIVEARTKISILSEIKIQFKPAVRQLESAI
ncbi:MAG: class I SAM-dependent methyltransferase, partial [Candidatus Omnitrophica bacterium]|nr:class I SAM-dependent methyltransferase [Candidatus Omnitrophota bacterium]